MKKSFIVLLLTAIVFSADAQLYNSLNQEQISHGFVNPTNLKRAGTVITATGFALCITGVFMLLNSPRECDMINPTTTGRCHYTEMNGGGVLLAGFVVTCVGAPVYGYARAKEKGYRIRLFACKSSASGYGIGLKVSF